MVLDSYGSETSLLKDNVLWRGDAAGVAQAVEVHGRFVLVGNLICGFDEEGACAVRLFADAIGRACRCVVRGNTFERCARAVAEDRDGLWAAAVTDGNAFIDCGPPPGQ